MVSRAVESAALEALPDMVVLTPAALEQQLELGLARACAGDGDDAACVVEFAAALDADWVLRPRLTEAQGSLHLTLSLFDGKRAELVAQATRSARVGAVDALTAQVPGMVVDVARKARIPVAEAARAPSPASLALVGGGVAGVALGVIAGGGSTLVEAQYLGARLDRGQAETWERARPFAWGAAAACTVAGVASLVAGALVWE